MKGFHLLAVSNFYWDVVWFTPFPLEIFFLDTFGWWLLLFCLNKIEYFDTCLVNSNFYPGSVRAYPPWIIYFGCFWGCGVWEEGCWCSVDGTSYWRLLVGILLWWIFLYMWLYNMRSLGHTLAKNFLDKISEMGIKFN